MSDQTTSEKPASSTRKFILPVAIVIVLIGVIGFIASQAGLDKALVKQAVDRFAADLAKSTAESPAQMTLTYKDIRLEGGFSSRFAIIESPEIREKNLRDESVTIYRTPEIELHPTSADLSSMRIEAARPITIVGNAESSAPATTVITQKSAITVDVAPEQKNGRTYIATNVSLPDAFLLDGSADEAGAPWQMTVTMAPGATIKRSVIEGGSDWTSLSDSSVSAKTIKIVPEGKPERTITIDAIESSFSNTLNEQNLNVVDINANIGPISGSKDVLPYGAITAALELNFEGALARSPEAFAEAKSNESSIKLKTLSLKSENAALYATADFVSGASDLLPVGTANITVENLPFVLEELHKTAVLDEQNEKLLATVVERTTGQPIGTVKDLSIDIKRVRDGAFQIGNTTFEEIMALVLKSALTNKMAPAVMPDAPAMPAEEPAPVEESPVSPAVSTPTPTETAPMTEEKPVTDEKTAPKTPAKGDVVPDTRG